MAEEIYRRIGRNIRERRLAMGWSLEKLAGTLGVSYQQLQKYETGTNRLPSHMLVILAARFGCSTDELCGLSREPLPLEALGLVRCIGRTASAELKCKILGLIDAAAMLASEAERVAASDAGQITSVELKELQEIG
ncbi:helix-turn-helix transcriptional regulator [Luteolibacter ambystomatis]|uniref:Helix-turn-helix transcriptional regulator n=1 Tax=Luteolibacter ambystomatis TaxID=2824561 RepID=A0A975PG37_9BACT|nr:helix-turn-helix transcriptional regulator [Luteolibacter ambystomatis]QUE52270.1 helix-turn-helix transcriptional regulator [Luteolibacter ambystomatis]